MNEEIEIRPMMRAEVDELVAWAAAEGWNPGLHDADLFWATDPDAFIAAELAGELIGGGSITSYSGDYGFMGFFIIRPAYRGQGFGNTLWHARRQRLLDRLKPHATIGMDGVFAMQSYYAKGGFVFSHRNLRFRTEIAPPPAISPAKDAHIVPLTDVPFEQIAAYDRTCFPASRTTFLQGWITQPAALALGYMRDGQLCGYGVIRRCQDGCKIGPLFADDGTVAEALYTHLAEFAAGGALFLDAPENQPAAMAFVARHQMEEVFGCGRMYLGSVPDVMHARIFGVTTFELG